MSQRYRKNKTLSSYSGGTNRGGELEGGRSERQRLHYVKARQKQTIYGLAFFGLIIIVLGIILYNYTARVTMSATSDQLDIVNAPAAARYEDSINKYLANHPAGRLRISLDKKGLERYLEHEHPEVKYVKRTSFNGLGVSNYDLVFREPIIKWQAGEHTYYVDSEGVSFQENIYKEPDINLRDASLGGGTINDGTVKLSRRILEFSGRLATSIQDKGKSIEFLTLPEDTTRQVAVKLVDSPTLFIFSIDQPVEAQVDAMMQASNYFTNAGYQPTRVDLRVPGRAYYK